MTEKQGDEPDTSTGESAATDAGVAQPETSADAATSTPETPAADAVATADAPTVPVVPERPTIPAHVAAQAQPGPQPWRGQPHPAGAYAGQPYSGTGQPIGTGAVFTAPTLPVDDRTAVAEKKRTSGGAKVAGLIVAAALVGGAAGIGGSWLGVNLWGETTVTAASGPSTITVNDTESVTTTTAVAAEVLPSVVTISATSAEAAGTGSGVVLSEDGYVVTNTHVVTLGGATADPTLSVTTSDGRVFDATIVGTDPLYDLAVIKLEGATDMTPIEFADSSSLNVGEEAIVVGAPLGLANTVTTGIVSALNRSIEVASAAAPDDTADSDSGDSGDSSENPFFFDFGDGTESQTTATESIKIAVIQTDAAINPGNSGGALVNSAGELIGVNVAIATASTTSDESGSIGVGFSIPSNIVERVTTELIENGEVSHGLLGANVQDAALLDGATTTGAYVAEVVSGGAAEAGGLQAGDVVTAFNGVPISDSLDLTAQVRAAAAGSDATVTYNRDGVENTIDVTLGSLSG